LRCARKVGSAPARDGGPIHKMHAAHVGSKAPVAVARAGVGPARVRVADIGGEEFDVAPAGGVAGVGDQRRHYVGVARTGERAPGWTMAGS
jgi:hypothetical protein